MDGLPEKVIGAIELLFQRPIPTLSSWALVAVATWLVSKWGYARSITTLKERVALKDDQIASFKEKLNAATPEEAQERLRALEAQLRNLSPRRLSDSELDRFRDVVGPQFQVIDFGLSVQSTVAQGLYDDLIKGLVATGLRVSTVIDMRMRDLPAADILMTVPTPALMTEQQARIANGFRALGLSVDLQAAYVDEKNNIKWSPERVASVLFCPKQKR